jgi:hypothetical protein
MEHELRKVGTSLSKPPPRQKVKSPTPSLPATRKMAVAGNVSQR